MGTALAELQRRMAACVMQPLTREENMRRRSTAGLSTVAEAEDFIKPNDRLTSFERLEIYNRQYWYRLFSSFEEDFPGLKSIVGEKKFQALMRAYLEARPSTSFTLRNLGSRLVEWLRDNPEWTAPDNELALEMAMLEWAHIDAFDNASWPRLTPEQLQEIDGSSKIALQPYVRLIEAHYAIDDALIALRSEESSDDISTNNASTGYVSRRRKRLKQMPREQIYIAVHRFEDTIYYRRLEREDCRMLLALAEGRTLEEAIEFAFAESAIPEEERPAHLQSSFAHWMSMGWFCTAPPEEER